VPATKKEKMVKSAKSVGSKLLLLAECVMTLLIVPFIRDEPLSGFFNNTKQLWETGSAIIVFTLTMRYFLILKNFNKIRQLATGPLSGIYSLQQHEKYKVTRKVENFNRIFKLYRRSAIVACIFEMFRLLFNLIFVERKAALSFEFPFDATQNWIFPFMIMIMIVWFLIEFSIVLVVDAVIYLMLIITSVELDIWRQDFIDLRDLTESEKAKKLPDLVERHIALFNVICELEDIFSPYFLLSLVLNSIITCLNLYQMILVNELLRVIMNFYISCVVMTTIGIICYLGQVLVNTSEQISHDIYDCGWESFKDIKLKKSVLFLLMRSQRPFKLTFMKFSDVNMEKFREVDCF
jgi:7tm Odorant receptor